MNYLDYSPYEHEQLQKLKEFYLTDNELSFQNGLFPKLTELATHTKAQEQAYYASLKKVTEIINATIIERKDLAFSTLALHLQALQKAVVIHSNELFAVSDEMTDSLIMFQRYCNIVNELKTFIEENSQCEDAVYLSYLGIAQAGLLFTQKSALNILSHLAKDLPHLAKFHHNIGERIKICMK